jgi:hypothetical protein
MEMTKRRSRPNWPEVVEGIEYTVYILGPIFLRNLIWKIFCAFLQERDILE